VSQLSPNVSDRLYDELEFLGTLDANLLVLGVTCATRDRITSLIDPRGRITRWEPGDTLELPSASHSGTLILHEVGSLTHDDQLRLLEWLEQNTGRTRVVCTASASLCGRLEAGLFNAKLYYRLNTLTLSVS
jgi:Sigma-54 interaction domain